MCFAQQIGLKYLTSNLDFKSKVTVPVLGKQFCN